MITIQRTTLVAAVLISLAPLACADEGASDAPSDGDPREWLQDEFRKLMVGFVDMEEFAIVCERSEDGLDLNKVQRRFFSAGYVRAWKEYQDYTTYVLGPGTGQVDIMSTGKWYWEMAGWVKGCRDAFALGKSIERAIQTNIVSHLGGTRSFDTLDDARVSFAPVKGICFPNATGLFLLDAAKSIGMADIGELLGFRESHAKLLAAARRPGSVLAMTQHLDAGPEYVVFVDGKGVPLLAGLMAYRSDKRVSYLQMRDFTVEEAVLRIGKASDIGEAGFAFAMEFPGDYRKVFGSRK